MQIFTLSCSNANNRLVHWHSLDDIASIVLGTWCLILLLLLFLHVIYVAIIHSLNAVNNKQVTSYAIASESN